MLPTTNLRRQHRQLLEVASVLRGLLDPNSLEHNAAAARAHFSSLSGILSVHLAVEDGVLYPALGRHHDPAVRELADRYFKEMTHLRGTFQTFSVRWRSVHLMLRNPHGFAREAAALLATMTDRIQREELELYPLVESEMAAQLHK